MNVNPDGNEKDGDDTEVYDGVHQNREAAGVHVSKLHHSASPRQLKQQSWRQQHEQYHRYQHRSPICHLAVSLKFNLSRPFLSLSLSLSLALALCAFVCMFCLEKESGETVIQGIRLYERR